MEKYFILLVYKLRREKIVLHFYYVRTQWKCKIGLLGNAMGPTINYGLITIVNSNSHRHIRASQSVNSYSMLTFLREFMRRLEWSHRRENVSALILHIKIS